MGGLSRRQFLKHSAALAAAGAGRALWTPGPGGREAWARTNDTVAFPAGTTFERTIVPTAPWQRYAFNRLGWGPGWPLTVRAELAAPRRNRERRRVGLATIVHVSDFQVPDVQSPARVEFLAALAEPPLQDVPFRAAQRPHEAVVTQVSDAAVRACRTVGRGPVTGRAHDFAVSTGDNVDNMQANELDWFFALMNGGPLLPNSGDRGRYEGVQDDEVAFYSERYWHPNPRPAGRLTDDNWKRYAGFPTLPGFLDAAVRPLACPGIGVPWYSVYGNHDSLVQGNAPANAGFESFATGGVKVTDLPAGASPTTFARGLAEGDPTVLAALGGAPSRPVTADPARRFVGPGEYVRRHLEDGGHPAGHGFTGDNLDRATLYYTFQPVDGVLGITLDSANRLGQPGGSIGRVQLAWLEARLAEAHSRFLDGDGRPVRGGGQDQLVVVFAHHNLPTMTNTSPSPDDPDRVLGPELEALLHRFPNVVAFVNGHSHINRIWARPDPHGLSGGFWELSTSAQIDYPEQVRILELVDNRDGSLSLFSTVVDHAGPAATLRDPARADDYGADELAAFGRELAFNDFRTEALARLGAAEDLNVELLLDAPFDLAGLGRPARPRSAPAPAPTPAGRGPVAGRARSRTPEPGRGPEAVGVRPGTPEPGAALPATGPPLATRLATGVTVAGAALGAAATVGGGVRDAGWRHPGSAAGGDGDVDDEARDRAPDRRLR